MTGKRKAPAPEAEASAGIALRGGTRHPPPSPALWSGIRDPGERLEAALRSVYVYYQQREQALANVLRDAERLPALEEALAPMRDYLEGVAEGLSAGWQVAPRPNGTSVLRSGMRSTSGPGGPWLREGWIRWRLLA